MTAALIRTIHIACRQLGLDEETRRDLQKQVTGRDSLSVMTNPEREAVLAALKERGFKPAFKGARKAADRGDVRFCHVLWGKLFRAGAVDKAGARGLNAFVRARFEKAWGAAPIDIDQMRDAEQIAAIAEALKAMCRRAGISTDKAR